MRLNGVPLFNPFHLAGLFSAFDPEATESIEIVPGAFPARVGDRLSSAIDVRTREGGRDRVRGGGALGLISSRMLATDHCREVEAASSSPGVAATSILQLAPQLQHDPVPGSSPTASTTLT